MNLTNQSDTPLSKWALKAYFTNKYSKIIIVVLIIVLSFLNGFSGVIVEGSLASASDNTFIPTPAPTSNNYYALLDQSTLMAVNSPVTNTISQKKIVTITAYSSTPDQTDDTPFITASNTIVHDGVIAANFLEFGTKIRIPKLFGNKIFTVEDRMHYRYQDNHIDIWFPDRESALNFGIKQAEIEILP